MSQILCQTCGAPATRLIRCADHYRCDDCGAKTGLILADGGVLCDSCVQKRHPGRGEACCYRNDVTCPYCGYVFTNSQDIANDCGELTCESCERIFSFERVVDISYNTRALR